MFNPNLLKNIIQNKSYIIHIYARQLNFKYFVAKTCFAWRLVEFCIWRRDRLFTISHEFIKFLKNLRMRHDGLY